MRFTILALLAVLCLPVMAGEDERLETADRFARLFMDGAYDELPPFLDAALSGAMPPPVARQVRETLIAQNGAVKSVGTTWLQDELQGYLRYRTPVEFEHAVLDLRVILDAEGKVAGLFHAEHEPQPGTEKKKAEGRPQDPAPPFPYREEDVEYGNGKIRLGGTLAIPDGDGPFPAVLLISGSGPQNRDSELFGHRPFHVWSDQLARAGVAVLRVDDRGVGDSSGDIASSTTEEFAADALAGVHFLAARPEIDAQRVGLLGHSEGGVVAPLAASRSDDVAFVVMLAGTGVPGDETLYRQMELISRAAGVSGEPLKQLLDAQRVLIRAVLKGKDDATVRKAMRELVVTQNGGLIAEDSLKTQVEQQTDRVTSRWFRFFLAHDPRRALRKVDVPVLALFGGKDLQVEPAQNAPEVQRALKKAGNDDATVLTIDGLNHLFQKAETGASGEYGAIDETINPEVLRIVGEWIVERFASDG
ncbi:MAG: alpha/beta fold hydrolase [bacterium]|nr:alpha/beta fold hydrolase [bacterium]